MTLPPRVVVDTNLVVSALVFGGAIYNPAIEKFRTAPNGSKER